VEDPTDEDEAAGDGAVVDFGVCERVGVVDEDVVCAVEEDWMDQGHAEEKWYENGSCNLVFAEQCFHAYVPADQAQNDDDGAHGRDPPRSEQRGLVLAEGPCRWRGRVEPHGGMAIVGGRSCNDADERRTMGRAGMFKL
jgi:hypothetical protein